MTFLDFATMHGLRIRHLCADGQIHRCPTDAKPQSDNGAYMLDGSRGWIMDWAIGDKVQWWNDPLTPWTEEAKREARRKASVGHLEKIERHRKVALEAQKILSEAEYLMPREGRAWKPGRQAVEAIPAHPYLVRKGFPTEPGFVWNAELLIPMFDLFDRSKPIGLQRIKPDGEKKFLSGQRAKGAIHCMGTGKSREIWLCEGYATALTVKTAFKKLYRNADVIACFSAGNIEYVASRGVGTHVMADHDASGVGERAAQATGLPYAIPLEMGMDANDLMVAAGIHAVCDLVQERRV